MAVGEGDDDAGAAADGCEVGVEGGQEQVVGCSMRLMAAETYERKQSALSGIESVKDNAPGAEIEDQTEE